MSYYEIALRVFVGLFGCGWAIVLTCHIYIHSYIDKPRALNMIDNFSKNPSLMKQNVALKICAGGGALVFYSLIYPLCRHRRKNKSLSFDLFMWMNWLWFMLIIFI